MITDEQKDAALLMYKKRGILKQEVRSYEVSLWTLQDEFITVLKWSDVEQKGRIEEPKMTLNVDGTQNFTFSIPMYLTYWNEEAQYSAQLELRENPIWYNTRNGNLIEGMRKIKVIFNKGTADEETFEFVIIKVTEKHEGDIATCEIECESLAFHELGKVGYKINLSQDNFELDYKAWIDAGMVGSEPIENLQYWCHEAGLVEWPANGIVNARTWYYYVDMDWSSFAFSTNIARDRHKVYEEPFTSAWTAELVPKKVQQYKEKARPVESSQSNLYNITQTIAEQFGVHCRYEYGHDENYQITSRVVVFYNNFNKENEGILNFSYPYSAKSVERTVDTTDLTTKLFIEAIDSDTELDGVITIMNSEANKTKEDYILNFDYIHKIGGITDEQYDAIAIYEKNIREVNEELIPLQLQLAAFERKKTETEANITTYKNSLDLDKEQIDYNQDILNSILSQGDVEGKEQDGYIHITSKSPDLAYIITNDDGTYKINLQHTKKGIDVNTVHIYRSWAAGTGTCSNEVSGWKPIYDDKYGNLIGISSVAPANNSSTVYLTYNYKPELYYEKIITTWKIKIANDNTNWEDNKALLAKIELHIAEKEARRDVLIDKKNNLITEFERMMGAALREGYWQPEDYNDYGETRFDEKTFTNSQTQNPFTTTVEDDFVIGWDPKLFDDEDKINYEVGINQALNYYPCVNLSSIFTNANIRNNIEKYSLIFNTNYYDTNADLNNIKYIRSFSIGSEALLKFVKNPEGTIFPILVLVGAKTMTNDEIAFMKDGTKGHPRLGIIDSTLNSTSVSTVISGAVQIHDSSYWTFGSSQIDACEIVYPRINFNTTSVKADTTNLSIAYQNSLLTPYEHYSILTRITEYGTVDNPDDRTEYYITLKPEAIWKCGTYTGKVSVNYVISNLATSIYVDAIEIAKNNSEPKVEYNLEANIINEKMLRTLYNDLARIIMITDKDLKLENAFGYISGIELDLDNPDNDTIEIKNYKNKFEDLFATIVASTESLTRDSDGIASALGGNIGLNATGFAATLLNNGSALQEYLDTYFTTSSTVEQTLESLFTEAGQILGDSKQTLGQNIALSQENASILSGFANSIVQELSPKVTRGQTQPADFKSGDIWIETDANGEEIGRYVATSDSLHSVAPYGFTRTYDGSLAQITGASLDVDAENGNISILAQNNIDIKSGNNVYIAANEKVDIVGNKSVNIGGTQINIGSTSIAGSNVQGGINIVATAYTDTSFADAHTSKVLISPLEIYMAGSKINMMSGTGSDNVSAIVIDGSTGTGAPSYGIWLGSNKGIRLYSGNSTNNANVEINPSHLFFGMNNTNNGNATAAEITEKHIIFAAGNALSNLDGDNENIGINNGIAGVKITKDKIGLATGSGANRTAILMDSSGFLVGTGADPQNVSTGGSYVGISGSGVIIGSKGTLTVTTTNFIVSPTATGTDAMFYVGTGGVTSSDKFIKYSPTNGLEIRGKITANELYIVENGSDTSATDWVNAKVTPAAIWLGVVKHTTGNNNATVGSSTSLEITDSKFEIKSTGDFIVDAANVKIKTNAGNGESIFKLTDGASTNAVNYINIAKNSSGVLTAQIGGWLISDKKLYSGSSSSYVALDANTSDSYAVWCGAESDVSAPFAVTRSGDVFLNSLLVLDNEHKINPNAAQVTRGSDKYSKVEFSKLNFNQAIVLSLTCGGTSIQAKGVFLGTWTSTATKSATASLSAINADAANITWGVGETTVTVNVADSGSLTFEHVTVNAQGIAQNAANAVLSAAERGANGHAYTSGSATFSEFIGISGTEYGGAGSYQANFSDHTISADVSMYRSGRRVYAKGIAKVGGTSVSETAYSYIDVPEDTGSGGSDNCFVGDTLVTMIDNTNIPIELLRMGDILLAYDEVNNQQVETEVVAIRKYKNSHDISEIRLPNRKPLFLTKSHTVLTADGWKALDIPSASHENPQLVINQLTVEDKMIDSNGNQVDILEIIDHPEMDGTPVYNIDVEPYDTYIVENVVVHNAIEKQA